MALPWNLIPDCSQPLICKFMYVEIFSTNKFLSTRKINVSFDVYQ